jgi:hypothetical protein
MKDIRIELDDAPNLLALIGGIMGDARVNIEGLSLITYNGRSVIHFAVEDAETAMQVLEESGIRVGEVSEVVVFDKDAKRVTGKPGSFGGICKMFADNGVKITFGYPAENNRFIFGVDNIARAQELLG